MPQAASDMFVFWEFLQAHAFISASRVAQRVAYVGGRDGVQGPVYFYGFGTPPLRACSVLRKGKRHLFRHSQMQSIGYGLRSGQLP